MEDIFFCNELKLIISASEFLKLVFNMNQLKDAEKKASQLVNDARKGKNRVLIKLWLLVLRMFVNSAR